MVHHQDWDRDSERDKRKKKSVDPGTTSGPLTSEATTPLTVRICEHHCRVNVCLDQWPRLTYIPSEQICWWEQGQRVSPSKQPFWRSREVASSYRCNVIVGQEGWGHLSSSQAGMLIGYKWCPPCSLLTKAVGDRARDTWHPSGDKPIHAAWQVKVWNCGDCNPEVKTIRKVALCRWSRRKFWEMHTGWILYGETRKDERDNT